MLIQNENNFPLGWIWLNGTPPNMQNSLYYIILYPVLTGNNSLVALLFLKIWLFLRIGELSFENFSFFTVSAIEKISLNMKQIKDSFFEEKW